MRTIALYSGIDAITDCTCEHCRTFRAAFDPIMLEASLRSACERIGIDPSKPLEISYLDELTNGSMLYSGSYPFFGFVDERKRSSEPADWWFGSSVDGTARVEQDVAGIGFAVIVSRT